MERVVKPIEAKYGEVDNEAIFTKHPRFGTWSLSFKRGDIPLSLKGEWQFLETLMLKTENYLAVRKVNKASLGEIVENEDEDGLGRQANVSKPKKARGAQGLSAQSNS